MATERVIMKGEKGSLRTCGEKPLFRQNVLSLFNSKTKWDIWKWCE